MEDRQYLHVIDERSFEESSMAGTLYMSQRQVQHGLLDRPTIKKNDSGFFRDADDHILIPVQESVENSSSDEGKDSEVDNIKDDGLK